eukprot:sb/3476936/
MTCYTLLYHAIFCDFMRLGWYPGRCLYVGLTDKYLRWGTTKQPVGLEVGGNKGLASGSKQSHYVAFAFYRILSQLFAINRKHLHWFANTRTILGRMRQLCIHSRSYSKGALF